MGNTYIWAPGIEWNVQKSGKVKIGRYVYPAKCQEFFPDLYFAMQNFIGEDALLLLYEEDNRKSARAFIRDLIKKRVLISGIMPPVELFLSQKKLHTHPYSSDEFYDPAVVETFKVEQLNRCIANNTYGEYQLNPTESVLSIFDKRKSCRNFSRQILPNNKFSNALSIFSQHRIDDRISYYYPSAGGLYPVDIFVYVKDNRVEEVNAGLYYYFPKENSLRKVSNEQITDEAHFSINKEIFNSSAFSVYFVYNAASSMPKYGGMGYYYACIDSGIMVASLNAMCEHFGIGACVIGEMNFKKIEKFFSLTSDQVFLHCMECGLKGTNDE